MQLEDTNRAALPDAHCIPPPLAFKQPVPTILLAEDEEFVRKVACEILGAAGYGVLPARNAAEAAEAFRAHPEQVHLLLTDVVLPDRNGCDLAQELLTLRRGVKPGWSYLPKPFSAASLLRKVKEVLNQE